MHVKPDTFSPQLYISISTIDISLPLNCCNLFCYKRYGMVTNVTCIPTLARATWSHQHATYSTPLFVVIQGQCFHHAALNRSRKSILANNGVPRFHRVRLAQSSNSSNQHGWYSFGPRNDFLMSARCDLTGRGTCGRAPLRHHTAGRPPVSGGQ